MTFAVRKMERNHQGLGNALLEAEECVGSPHGKVRCRKRLGGLLSYYHRDAAEEFGRASWTERMVWRRGLLGVAYRRASTASTASAGLREF